MSNEGGPLLVALPGLGLGPEAWAPTLDRLPRRSQVLTLPGYGVRAAADQDLRPPALAERVVDALPANRPVVLLGHSASCQVAAHAAVLRPGSVRGLVLVGPTTDPRASSWSRLAARWLATARHETPHQVPTLVRLYRRTTLRSMARAMDAARREPVRPLLSRTSTPLLVLRGPHDRICPSDWAHAVARSAAARAHAVTVAEGGHMVPLTHGPLVGAEIDAWIARPLSIAARA